MAKILELNLNQHYPIPKATFIDAVIEFKVLSIERDGTYLKARDTYRKNVFLFPVTQLGKTLFVNKEDAEKLGADRWRKFFNP